MNSVPNWRCSKQASRAEEPREKESRVSNETHSSRTQKTSNN